MSTVAQALGIKLDLAIGPLVVGAIIVAFLHSLVLVQAAAYGQHFWSSDPVFVRVWVCVATVLSTASVLVIAAFAYRVAVSHWGNPSVLVVHNGLVDAGAGQFQMPSNFISQCRLPALIGLPGTCLQSFLIYRIYRLFVARFDARAKSHGR
jgi:hypothetical protein